MPRTKKSIENYKQLRECVGNQMAPTPDEKILINKVFREEAGRHNDLTWALYMVYVLGKVKGSGRVTHKDLESITDLLQPEEKKKAFTTANSEGKKIN
ncbi:hypothetical protein [Cytobacillus sp. FSL H8-0458]|uniref:hypothetical protein n=1 Tax=Cytobacillus sp. FSL H8-0458 TaxID=2975346 RepID=UPI0030F65C6E